MSTPTTDWATPARRAAPYPSPEAISRTVWPETKFNDNAYLWRCSYLTWPFREGIYRSPVYSMFLTCQRLSDLLNCAVDSAPEVRYLSSHSGRPSDSFICSFHFPAAQKKVKCIPI